MIVPSPDLERKIMNTEALINSGNAHLVDEYASLYPYDYLDLGTYNRLMAIKPWQEG